MNVDRLWMDQVLALAALGEGTARPNPRVGCLVVLNGRVVGWGYHRAAGREHAEAAALGRAGEQGRGATMYVNLEPCAHHGRTPPCADRIVEAGIRQVVASIQDPNPRVDGRGFRHLRDAGIEVEIGTRARQARELNAGFLRWHRTGRPAVTLKAALTQDGAIATRDGASRWITGPAARRFAHRLRLRHDAVVVGAGTVRTDNPRLDIRLDGVEGPGPVRVVVSRGLDLDPGARVFAGDGPRTRVYTSADADPTRVDAIRAVADVVPVAIDGDRIDLRAVLDDLGSLGVQSVLVEGGGKTLAGFLDVELADRAAIFRAPMFAGARGATPMLDLDTIPEPAAGVRLIATHRMYLGDDAVTLGTIAGPSTED